MSTDQPDQNTTTQPGADQPHPDAAPDSGQEGTVIPSPAPAGGPARPASEAVEREPAGEPEYTRPPMPVVLPRWLRSRATALSALRWAGEYAGRHVAFRQSGPTAA